MAAQRIARVFVRRACRGLLQIVHGEADAARALVSAPEIAHVRFTGSSQAGRDVGEACARELKRATIEVGGKDPMLVLADANIPRAVAGAVWGAFANAGQSGGSLARAYVLRERAERFTTGVVAGARALQVGHPRDPRTEIGPLLAGDRLARLVELIDEAVAGGATLHCGGPVAVGSLSGAFFAPAVLSGVPADARLLREDAPGPWLAIDAVDTEHEGIARCNAGVGGLGASVWTADQRKGARVAREIRAGMVWMNDHLVSRAEPQLPWGAVHGSASAARAARSRCGRPSSRSSSRPIRPPAGWRGGSPTTSRSCRRGARSRTCARCAMPIARRAGAAAPGRSRASRPARSEPRGATDPLLSAGAASVEPQLADLGGALLVVEAAHAREVAQQRQLLDGIAPERLVQIGERAPDDAGALAGERRELDQHAPPVARIGPPPRVARLLEAVDDRGDRRRRQPAGLREPAGGDGPLAVDDVHAAPVGPVDAHGAARRVVQQIDGDLPERTSLPSSAISSSFNCLDT